MMECDSHFYGYFNEMAVTFRDTRLSAKRNKFVSVLCACRRFMLTELLPHYFAQHYGLYFIVTCRFYSFNFSCYVRSVWLSG